MAPSVIIAHDEVLDHEWTRSGRTAIELPPVDVNGVLADHYEVDRPGFTYTGSMLWDMEQRKAAAPDVYLPSVVRPGSVETFEWWTDGTSEYFVRVSDQRLWLDPHAYGTVIEHVRLDHDTRRAFFLGVPTYDAPDGRTLRAGDGQPIFHVEHSVVGGEDRPLNEWRIVHLTEAVDPAVVAHFDGVARNPYLRDFHEVYLRDHLGLGLRRR